MNVCLTSEEPMGITECCFSSHEMLLSKAFSCWLFVELFAFSLYSVTEKHVLLGWYLTTEEYCITLPWEILGFAFCIIHLHCALLCSFVAFSSIWLENSLVHFSLVFLSAVMSSINSTDLVPLPLHCLHNVWQNLWYFRDCELSLSLVHLGFICSKNCAEIFPSKFILGVLFSTNGLHLVVNTLNLDSCRCFLIADFHNDTTHWRVLDLGNVTGFFIGNPLYLSSVVSQAFWCCWGGRVNSFFL